MEEKMARATTAAIRVEKLAMDSAEAPALDTRPDIHVETDAAIYDDGKVKLKGNPLKTTKDVLCPRCHLPRLREPTDGKGAKKPDPGIIYCKKHPYIDKPGYDIYGQTWMPQGPGRGKKKKDMEKKLEEVGIGAGEARPPNVLSYPSATCSKCKRCILVTRLNNHMGSCIGNSGRNASRAAAQKISNGGSQNDGTPPSSQKGTPRPGSRASSPKKREGSNLEEDEDSESSHKTKKLKPSAPVTKIKIKSKILVKKDKPKASSSLSVEQKADDLPSSPAVDAVAPKKSNPKAPSPSKKATKITAKLPPTSAGNATAKAGRDPDAASVSSTTSTA
jgi:hypothetical protein